ncbi:MAG: condensation domain-containing protein, partial [Thermoanaerobaculia bacterium]
MLPAAFVRLGVLPLTPNGKLDRQALEQIGVDPEEPEAGGPEDLPRDPVEEVLTGIWSDLLGRERLGVHDNFFELGGHSLLGTRLVSRLRHVFGIELPLRALFEAPTIAAMAPLVKAARSGPGRAAPALAATARGLASPLSFAQERLWFLDQIEPGSPAYNIPAAVRLTGALDVAALAASLSAIIERHEVLRTTFETCDGQPVQVIHPLADLPSRLPVIDLRALPDVEREAEAHRIALAEARQPFELARGPLVRTVLLQLAPLVHAVLIGMHHIVSDGWSAGVLIRELQALYGELSAGRPALLPPLPIQYADFAAWQRAWLQGEVLASQLAGWRRLLAGAPTLLELPTDRPRPPSQSYRGDDVPVVLAPELARALVALGRRCGATPFMVLLAAFQALLARWSGQERVVVGSPVANRTYLETEPLIGFFVNTLALPGDLTGEPSFAVLLDRVRDATLTAHAHQDLPFERLVEELQPARSLSHSPIFQAMLAWQNTPAAPLEMPGLVLEPLQAGSGAAKFDLTLSLAGLDDSFRGVLNYATALFDRTTAERLAGHLQSLLAAISAEPDAPVWHLPLLTPAEVRQMAEWNATDAAFPLETTSLHALIAIQAERTPDAVAVVFEECSLSYRALETSAGHLAGRLRRLGVGPDVLVGIAAERSLELVVGLLAILKAGGAYVPLDPSYPRERLAYLLEDSRVPILLTQERLLSVLPPHGAVVVLLDEQAGEAQAGEECEASSAVAADHLAYLIYTSGSTGWPKGAMNTHRGIVNRLLWMQQRFELTAGDRVLQKTPISFDVSVWELFWPLLAGATLIMARPGGHQDSAYLVDTIVEREVTTLHFVPPMLHAFLETPGSGQCPTLRLVLASGEALPAELVRRFYAQRGTSRANLHNLY